MRAFIAIPVPDETAAALVRLQAALPHGRPVPEDNLHLTLAFLGDVPEPVLADLDDALAVLAWIAPEVRFSGLDSFTEAERGTVFAAVERTEALVGLQAKLETLARGLGSDLPRRRFRPHVTLTRGKRRPSGLARDRLATQMGMHMEIPGFLAEEIVLYQSILMPSGARHTALASYPAVGRSA